MTEECTWYGERDFPPEGFCRLISEYSDCKGDIGWCKCELERLAELKAEAIDREIERR